MSRGLRSAVLAIGLALAGVAHAQPVSGDSGNKPGPKQGQTQVRPNQDKPKPPTIQELLQRITSALEAANAKPPPPDDSQRAQRDLEAQQEMAKWAKFMFFVSGVGVVVTLVGVFLVARTLVHTRGAVREAKRAADAMQNAERPHMIMSDIKIAVVPGELGDDDVVVISLFWEFKNYGRSPAFIKQVCVEPLPEEYENTLPMHPPYANITDDRHIVAPDGTFTTLLRENPREIKRTDLYRMVIFRGIDPFYVFGFVEYEDTFGAEHTHRFCYRMRFGQPPKGGGSEGFVSAGPENYREYT